MSDQPAVDLLTMLQRLQRLEATLCDCEATGFLSEANKMRMVVDLLRWRVRRHCKANGLPLPDGFKPDPPARAAPPVRESVSVIPES